MIFLFNKVLLLSHVKYCVPGGIISSYEIRHRCFFLLFIIFLFLFRVCLQYRFIYQYFQIS